MGERKRRGKAVVMAEPRIEREEIVALLSNVADIAAASNAVAEYLTGEDGAEEEDDEG